MARGLPRLVFALAASLAAGVGAPAALALGPAPAQLQEWRGEYFDQKQGGLFVAATLKGFKAGKQSRFITGPVQVTLYDVLNKKAYLVTLKPGDGQPGAPDVIWKLPSGKYLIRHMVMVDAAGVRRSWTGGTKEGERKTFGVKRLSLSNLGLWTLSPEGETGLSVRFTMTQSGYKERGTKKESSVQAVINGFTGLEQESFGGKGLAAAAERDYGSQKQLRASVTFTRKIAMYYTLDLFKHNRHARGISAVLSVSDPNVRTCYTNRLEWSEGLRGSVKYTFLLSKETGTMSRLKHTGGTVKDAKLVECVYWELAQIQFPVPENMIGELTYTFDVK